jgi:ubiquitin carboxyl-terminal hydrolase 47
MSVKFDPGEFSALASRRSVDNDESKSAAASGNAPGDSPPSLHRVGLTNQGGTCYLNSLIQTLFMTPEFREMLYAWRRPVNAPASYDETSIPFQLQLLFASLQLSPSRAVSTKALTKSFGWSGSDVFTQHDVHELVRILFDALEDAFSGTANAIVMTNLFKGALRDFVRCTECSTERPRHDTILDLSLVIKPFGSTQVAGSVDEALEEFIKVETLDVRFSATATATWFALDGAHR